VLHVSAHNPSQSITKADLRLYSEQIAYGLHEHYGIGTKGPYKDVVTILSSGQAFVPAIFFGVVGGKSSQSFDVKCNISIVIL
jgi:hypothetical protein